MYDYYWYLTQTVDLTDAVDLSATVDLSADFDGYIPVISDLLGDGLKHAVLTVLETQVFPAVYMKTQVFTMTVR